MHIYRSSTGHEWLFICICSISAPMHLSRFMHAITVCMSTHHHLICPHACSIHDLLIISPTPILHVYCLSLLSPFIYWCHLYCYLYAYVTHVMFVYVNVECFQYAYCLSMVGKHTHATQVSALNCSSIFISLYSLCMYVLLWFVPYMFSPH